MAKLGEANIGGRMVPAWLLNLTAEELDGLKWHSNRNLLDNWYFADPINQRGGYVVPPGVTYYQEDGATVGQTGSYYTVTSWDGAIGISTAHFKINEISYKFDGTQAVRGYTGAGYGIDRWRFNNNGVLLINDGYITFINKTSWIDGICEPIEPELMKSIIGKTVTASILLRNGQLYSTTITITSGASTSMFAGVENNLSFYYNTDTSIVVFSENTDCEVSPVAAKLELGSQQTLAHQENGVWQLNEIPDYGEQLRRCQRYARWMGGCYSGYIDNVNNIQLSVPEIKDMRATPVISNITWDRYVAISGGEGAYFVSSDYQTHLLYNGLRIGNTGLTVSKYLPVSIVFGFIAFLSADL